MFNRILVCSDGSDQALHAAGLAAKLAKQCDASLLVLNVFDLPAAMALYAAPYEQVVDAETLVGWASEAQEEVLKRTEEVCVADGAAPTLLNEMGNPVDVVCATAEREQADLIVIGSRGLNTWQVLLMGSISEGVMHQAHCPVLIVRGAMPALHKILLATDGSKHAARATRAAGELAHRLGADLTVLSVFEPRNDYSDLPQGEVHPEDLAARVLDTVAHNVSVILDVIPAPYTILQKQGHPAEVIVRTAIQIHSDLIVTGSRGFGALKGMLMGSVSNRVAHHAPCSLLVER